MPRSAAPARGSCGRGKEIAARDQVGLRALNDALRAAFDAPDQAGLRRAASSATDRPDEAARAGPASVEPPPRAGAAPSLSTPRCGSSSRPCGSIPASSGAVSLLFDPARIAPGHTDRDRDRPGALALAASRQEVPEPGAGGWSRVGGSLRALVSAEPGSRLERLRRGGRTRRRAPRPRRPPPRERLGPRDRAQGRRLARSRRSSSPRPGSSPCTRGGASSRRSSAPPAGRPRRARVREYVPYRMLEVEVAANAVYWWAAERILARRLPGERPCDPPSTRQPSGSRLRCSASRSHDKLMRAFLGPEVFDGTVVVGRRDAPRERATSAR